MGVGDVVGAAGVQNRGDVFFKLQKNILFFVFAVTILVIRNAAARQIFRRPGGNRCGAGHIHAVFEFVEVVVKFFHDRVRIIPIPLARRTGWRYRLGAQKRLHIAQIGTRSIIHFDIRILYLFHPHWAAHIKLGKFGEAVLGRVGEVAETAAVRFSAINHPHSCIYSIFPISGSRIIIDAIPFDHLACSAVRIRPAIQ